MSFIGKNIKKIRTVKKLSQAAFAELFNLARPSVGAYEEGRTEPKIDTLIAIANHFGLSTDALLRKELTVNELYSLDILKGEFDPTQMPPALGKSSRQENQKAPLNQAQQAQKDAGVPLVDRESSLEYIVNLGNRDFISTLPTVLLPQEGKGLQRAFVHSGQEMFHNECGIRQGDILLAKQQTKANIPNLKADALYVVVTRKRILSRRLVSADKTKVELKADNPAFEVVTMPIEEILEAWEVQGLWTRYLSPPAFLESKMLLLESRLESMEEKFNQILKEK